MLFSMLFHPGNKHVRPEDVPSFVKEMTVTQLVQFSIATLLLYDIMITVDKEIEHFWKRPIQLVKIIYFLNRYLGLYGALAYLKWGAFNPMESQCQFSRWSLNSTNCVIIISIDYILMKRVLALYLQGKRMEKILGALLFFSCITKITLFGYIQARIPVLVGILAEGTTVCGESGPQPPIFLYIIDWGVPLLFEGILMVLALYRASKYWKRSTSFSAFLIRVLIRDQVIYLFLATFCSVLSIIENNVPISNTFISAILLVIGNPSLLCVLGSRMLFNLKESAINPYNNGSISEIGSGHRQWQVTRNPQESENIEMGPTQFSLHSDERSDAECGNLTREDCMITLREMRGDTSRSGMALPAIRFHA